MPIGSAKIGVLGAGLVPGGTQTFNASGTFSVPPGVKKVNITGKGATGNPGNAGNAGSPGNVGNGGAGGGAGGSSGTTCPLPCIGYVTGSGEGGGWAYRSGFPNIPGIPGPGSLLLNPTVPSFTPWRNAGTAPPTYSPGIGLGAGGVSVDNAGVVSPRNAANAEAGTSGSTGGAGNAGNAGTAGNSSSTLCKTFPGGAGGNAGVGGAGGSGGSGGGAGNNGGNYGNGAAGSGGCGGGSGGSGSNTKATSGTNSNGASGGGGAGVTNSGASGLNSNVTPVPTATPFNNAYFSRGGNSPFSANFACEPIYNSSTQPSPPAAAPPNMTGGLNTRNSITSAGSFFGSPPDPASVGVPPNRDNLSDFGAPGSASCNIWRSGAGGGRSSTISFQPYIVNYGIGGGGGGGGRGGAAGAGGNSSAPSGSAATPQTFNCVAVTPGGSVPVTVASPGGQIVISWNPQ